MSYIRPVTRQDLFSLLTAFKAGFVEFVSSGHTFFGSVYGFAAFRAFWVFYWLERHFDWFFRRPETNNFAYYLTVNNFTLILHYIEC